MKSQNLLLMGSLLCPAIAAAQTATFAERPNFIILFIDDMGYNDVGYRTSSFQTPNIDRMAQEGIDFVNAYVPSPTSSPSRVALLTGRHPLKVGLTRHIQNAAYDPFNNGEFGLDPKDPGQKPNRQFLPHAEVTFAEALQAAGYETCAVGKWHLGRRNYYPDTQGFNDMYGESDLGNPAAYFPPYFTRSHKPDTCGVYLTDYLTDCAVEKILTNDYDKAPLCLYLAHYGVHSPHMAKSEMVEKYVKQGMDRKYAIYHAMVESVDQSLGRVLEAVKQAGVEQNTVVMFISDQGGYFTNSPLRGGKLTGALYEGGAKVPFLVKYPGCSPRRVTERITTMDVFPTLLEMAGLSREDYPQLEGQSLCRVLAGGKYRERPIYFYRSYDDQPAALIEDDFKLIFSRSGNHQLYDLNNDPCEQENLAHERKYASRYRKMLAHMQSFLDRFEPNSIPYPQK